MPWARLGLVFATLLWAGNFIAGRALRDEMAPLELNVWRWAIALVVLLPFTAGAIWRQRETFRSHLGLVFALGATGVVIPHSCVYAALQSTTAVNALLLMCVTPLLILLGARIFFGQPIRLRQWFGMLVALAGAVTLIVRGSVDAVLALDFGAGDRWMLPVVVSGAAQVLLLRRSPAGVAQAPLLTVSIIAALAMMLPLALLAGNLPLPSSARLMASLGYMGVLASALAFVLWNRGVARIGPSSAGPYIFLMPVHGSVLSLLILREPVQTFQYAGAALVLLGLWLAHDRARGRR